MNIRKLESLTKEELIEIIRNEREGRPDHSDLVRRLVANPTSDIMREAAAVIESLMGPR